MDLAILQWIQDNLRCGILDTIMPAVTALGSGASLWLALAAVLLLRPQTRRTGWMLLGALALETVCCNLLLKPLVARPRPFALEPGIQLLIAPPGGGSPSRPGTRRPALPQSRRCTSAEAACGCRRWPPRC